MDGDFRCICDPNDLFDPPDPRPRAVAGCPAHRARRAAQRFIERNGAGQPMGGMTPELPKIDSPGPIAVTNEELLQFVQRAGVYNHASADALVTIVRHFLNEAHRAGREDAARLADETAEAILVAHQRSDIRGCLCGWSELGKSHPRHQIAMLRQAAYEVLDQGINLGRSRQGVGDNTEEQQQEDGRG